MGFGSTVCVCGRDAAPKMFSVFLVSDDVYILFKIYVLNSLISLLFHIMCCAHIVANYFCANEIVVNVPL